jgi:hypothetical protein
MTGRYSVVMLAGASALLAAAVAARGGAAGQDGIHARSVAAFAVMDRVLTSPRCQNCHTLTQFPRQGDDRHPHRLNMMRGIDGHGATGMACTTCHGRANNAASGVPGADEDWHLAPLSMGWEGLSPALRCAHLKDPAHNGGRDGAAIIAHLDTNLVAWAWRPGSDAHGRPRTPPPVGYAAFKDAAATWVATGAACPAAAR